MRLFSLAPIVGIGVVLLFLTSPGHGIEPAAALSSPASLAPVARPPGPLIPNPTIQVEPEKMSMASGIPVAAPGSAPQVVILRLDSPIIVRQDSPATVAGESSVPPVRPEPPAVNAPSETSRKVLAVVERLINTVMGMNGATLFVLAAVIAMLVFYSLEDRSPFFILAFAGACLAGSTLRVSAMAMAVRNGGGDLGRYRDAEVVAGEPIEKWRRRKRQAADVALAYPVFIRFGCHLHGRSSDRRFTRFHLFANSF